MSETSVEDQAALAIVFEENIRELVRKHLKAALEDHMFMQGIGDSYPLTQTVMRSLTAGDYNFQQAVKQVIINQMQKY